MCASIGPQQINASFGPCGELLRRPFKQHTPAVQHDHAGAALGLIQIGGRPHHRHAVMTQILHHAPQFATRLRVNAHPRFVEQQQTRRTQQGTGNAQLLLHAARQPAREAVSKGGKTGEAQQLFKHAVALCPFQPAQAGVQAHVGHDRNIFVQAKTLRHVADAVGLAAHELCGAVAEKTGLPLAWRHEPGHDAHERGFACGIGPHQPGYAASGNDGIYTVKSGYSLAPLAKAHDQPLKADGLPLGSARGHGAGASCRIMVTGIPCRMTLSGSSACTRRRYTKAVRTSRVSTVLGVNSAVGEIKPTLPA